MRLSGLDWAIMIGFFATSLAIGLATSRISGRDFASFFLGSRKMPWWLLGISMVATTFSTDTPNLVADIVRTNGVVGNWVWWAFLLTGMLTVFLYAKLWRRSGVLTDVEFYELRYSGGLAAFLRGFRAAYLGILFNIIIMASVTLAAIKIGAVLMGWTPLQTVAIAAGITMVYSALGGLRGVLLTDLVQFGLAMVGSIWAAIHIIGLPEVGGLRNLLSHPNVAPSLDFLPNFDEMSLEVLLPVFFIPLAVQWWASYYPGAEPGGGGYVAQRMLSATNERHAVGATLLFNGLHYALRPWPWIIVALASLIIFPDLDALAERFPLVDRSVVRHDMAYPAMLTFLPSGLLGLVITSLSAAYMSTMSSQVNWGSSIIVNDLYHRFANKDATEHALVWAGRLSTVVLMVVACTLALFMENALQVFELVLQIGAGTGLLFILRWFWWRVNAAAELVAMVVSFTVAVYFVVSGKLDLVGGEWLAWQRLSVGVVITTAAWVATCYVGPQTSVQTLEAFYRKIRPGGPGWRGIRMRVGSDPAAPKSADLPYALAAALLGALSIYGLLFATGFVLYESYGAAAVSLTLAAVCAYGLWRCWPRLQMH